MRLQVELPEKVMANVRRYSSVAGALMGVSVAYAVGWWSGWSWTSWGTFWSIAAASVLTGLLARGLAKSKEEIDVIQPVYTGTTWSAVGLLIVWAFTKAGAWVGSWALVWGAIGWFAGKHVFIIREARAFGVSAYGRVIAVAGLAAAPIAAMAFLSWNGGWAARPTATADLVQSASNVAEPTHYNGWVTGTVVNLRDGPNGRKISSLSRGTPVVVVGQSSGWLQVLWGPDLKKTAWIYGKYVSRKALTNPPPMTTAHSVPNESSPPLPEVSKKTAPALGVTSASISPATPSASGRGLFHVRAYNIDDIATILVNGQRVTQVGYRQDSGWVNIDPHLKSGKNVIDFQLRNRSEGWTYGFQLKEDDRVLWEDSCGQVGSLSCDRPAGRPLAFSSTYELDLENREAGTDRNLRTIRSDRAGATAEPDSNLKSMSALEISSAPPLPLDLTFSADEVVSRVVEAFGGGSAVDGLQAWCSRTTTRVTMGQAAFSIQAASAMVYPGRYRQDLELPSGTLTHVITEDDAFVIDDKGVRDLPANQEADMRGGLRRHPLSLLRLRNGDSFKVSQPTASVIAGVPVLVLQVDVAGEVVELGVERATGHIVRMSYIGVRPDGSWGMIEESFSEFRSVAGLNLAHRRVLSADGAELLVSQIDAITINEMPAAERFERPQARRARKKP